MIRASRSLAASALVVSGALHVGGVSTFWSEERVKVEGGAPVSMVRVGNSFQDVAQGTQTPERPVEAQKSERVDIADGRVIPDKLMEPEESADSPDRVEPERTEAETPTRKTMASEAPAGTPPESAEPVETAPTSPRAEPRKAIRPERPQTETAAKPAPQETEAPEPQVVAALPQEGNETAPVLSSRPKTRPEGHAPPQSKPEPKKTASRAGSDQPEQVRGSAEGQRQAVQTQRSERQSAAASQAGSAAASNYPGQVMRVISRQRRPGVNSRGTATISFQIAADGALAGIGVARSSGSQALDAAAVQLVRRAAPFPAPPAGARSSFTIGIEVR